MSPSPNCFHAGSHHESLEVRKAILPKSFTTVQPPKLNLLGDFEYLKEPISPVHLSGFNHQDRAKYFDLTNEC